MTSKYNKTSFPVKGWAREEQFHFFHNFSQPYFNVHTQVDLSALYGYCKRHDLSVFLAYLYVTLQAARAIENFRLRLEGDQVAVYEGLDLSTTILKNDQTISFVSLPYHEALVDFCAHARQIISQAKESKALFIGYQGPDTLHLTTLPWFTFKGMEHAFSVHPPHEGVPKIAFGKIEVEPDRVVLPMSVALHHALADGYHLHLFLEQMQAYINAFGFLE